MVDFVRQVASPFGSDYTNNPSLSAVQASAGDMIIVFYSYREEASRIVAPPTWNGQTMTEIQARVQLPSAAPDCWFHAFSVIAATSGTYNVVGSIVGNEYLVVNSSAIVLSGPFNASPFSAVQSLHQWASIGYVNPALSITGVATGDLVVDVLIALLWDESFTSLPATTWALAEDQVQRVSLLNTNTHVGRQYVSTTSGSGTIDVGYTPSAGKPGFGYFAFIVKSSAGGAIENPGLRIKVQDRLGGASPDATNYAVVVRSAVAAASVLLSSTTAPVVSGHIEIDSDSVGDVGDVVYVSIAKQGASIALDYNASGRATVVDLNEADES